MKDSFIFKAIFTTTYSEFAYVPTKQYYVHA